MGVEQSKHRILYDSVRSGDINLIRSLHGDGASVDWMSVSRKTPLILACSAANRFEIAKVILELGADVNRYDPEHSVGTAIQNAARRGLEQTVILLLSHGADPLLRDSYRRNALDCARRGGYAGIVRAIEKEICLFSGCLRAIGGTIDPFGTSAKKILTVVLPSESKLSRNAAELKIALYRDELSPKPFNVISLKKFSLQQPDFTSVDPYLLLSNKSTGVQLKLLSGEEGNTEDLMLLYDTCAAEFKTDKPLPGTKFSETPQPMPSGTAVSSASQTNEPSSAMVPTSSQPPEKDIEHQDAAHKPRKKSPGNFGFNFGVEIGFDF